MYAIYQDYYTEQCSLSAELERTMAVCYVWEQLTYYCLIMCFAFSASLYIVTG